MTRRRTLSLVTVTLVGLAVVVALLSEARRRTYQQERRVRTAWLVGRVAIDYIRQQGAVPEEVETLFSADLLKIDEVEERVYAPPRGYYPQGYAVALPDVTLDLPPSRRAFRVEGELVLNRQTGAEVRLVAVTGLNSESEGRLNRLLAKQWYTAMRELEESREAERHKDAAAPP